MMRILNLTLKFLIKKLGFSKLDRYLQIKQKAYEILCQLSLRDTKCWGMKTKKMKKWCQRLPMDLKHKSIVKVIETLIWIIQRLLKIARSAGGQLRLEVSIDYYEITFEKNKRRNTYELTALDKNIYLEKQKNKSSFYLIKWWNQKAFSGRAELDMNAGIFRYGAKILPFCSSTTNSRTFMRRRCFRQWVSSLFLTVIVGLWNGDISILRFIVIWRGKRQIYFEKRKKVAYKNRKNKSVYNKLQCTGRFN